MIKQAGKYLIVAVVGAVFWSIVGALCIEPNARPPQASSPPNGRPTFTEGVGSTTQLPFTQNNRFETPTQTWDQATTPSKATPRVVAENGGYYGQLNDNGVPKTVYVRGYFRSDGTYVRSHFRSPPYSNPPYARQDYRPASTYSPHVAENGSYHGQLNNRGQSKRVYVQGYYRKDGTYVRGYYRSR